MQTNFLLLLTIGAFVGAAAGFLGSFMVLKRMSLVGDALSHVALPGMAIALTFNFSPILGAFVALLIAVLGVWHLQEKSGIYPDALIGIFFTASLALGILITPEPELLEALFGDIAKITNFEGVLSIVMSLTIILLTAFISKSIILATISEEMAKSAGINTKKVNLIYLILIGLIVALGVRFVGTLLMGALVIIPAVSAKNISHGIKSYYLLATTFGVLSSVTGLILTNIFATPPGPSVVLASVAIFLLTLMAKSVSPKKIS